MSVFGYIGASCRIRHFESLASVDALSRSLQHPAQMLALFDVLRLLDLNSH
jgi:hypothetical protein